MRQILFILFFFSCFLNNANTQTFLQWKDTVNKFSIGLPAGWVYKVPGSPNTAKLMAWTPLDSGNRVRDIYIVHVMDLPGCTPEMLNFTHKQRIAAKPGIAIIDSGTIVQNNKTVAWMEELHTNPNKSQVLNTIFSACDHDKAYIYTASTTFDRASLFRRIFLQLGKTLRTGDAIHTERLNIAFPNPTDWKIAFKGCDSLANIIQFIPANESAGSWSSIIHQASITDFIVDSIQYAVKIFSSANKTESLLSRVTILKEVNLPHEKWAIFKSETPSFPNDPLPESQLWYLYQGKTAFHVSFAAIKEKSLSDDFVHYWTEIFRKSKPVIE